MMYSEFIKGSQLPDCQKVHALYHALEGIYMDDPIITKDQVYAIARAVWTSGILVEKDKAQIIIDHMLHWFKSLEDFDMKVSKSYIHAMDFCNESEAKIKTLLDTDLITKEYYEDLKQIIYSYRSYFTGKSMEK